MHIYYPSPMQVLTIIDFNASKIGAVGVNYLADALKVNQVRSISILKMTSQVYPLCLDTH